MSKEKVSQWSVHPNDVFYASYDTTKDLPAGVYDIFYDHHRQRWGFRKQEVKNDDLLRLPIPEFKEIIKDIDNFWKNEKIYKEYSLIYKRGILLYGPPGCGKTSIINLLSYDLINNRNGVVIYIKDTDSIKGYINLVCEKFRSIEPDRPIITIIEDIDNVKDSPKSVTSKLLSILDGVKQIDKVVYIATTNYIEELEPRIFNRPSRFDRRFKIGKPKESVRKYYIERKLKSKDLKTINLKDFVKETRGLSIAHIKELLISAVLLKNTSFNIAINQLKNLELQPHSSEDRERGIGFKAGSKEESEDDYEYEDYD